MTRQVTDQKHVIRSLTFLGLLLSLFAFFYLRAHPQILAVGGQMQGLIQGLGVLGPLLFIALQVVQVIYPIIPGGMTSVIGHIIFGPLLGFSYNVIGIFIGSLLAFGLARRYGSSFAKAFVSDATYDKYIAYLDRKDGRFFAWFLAAAFALPGFPDDFLCMVAGLSKMSLKRFVWIFILTKPATLYLYTLLSCQGLTYLLRLFS